MNILNREAAPHCGMYLNTLLLLVEIQCPFGSKEDSDPVKLIYVPYCSWVSYTDEQTEIYTVGASAGLHSDLKGDCCLLGWTSCFPHISLAGSLMMIVPRYS